MIKTIVPLILIATIFTSCTNKRYNKEITPYVNFLEKDHEKAKDYVLDLFKKNDIVILCERDHRENTQYEFIKELVSDPRFIHNVGNIFTEVGMRSLNPEINRLIHSDGIPDSVRKEKIIELQRRCSFYPLWEKYNFYYFVESLYEFNQGLKKSEKINLYPTDVALKLDSMNVEYLKGCWYGEIAHRDSLMADYIIKKFEKIEESKAKRKKALIIMNYRHSFNNNFKEPNGRRMDNVGKFLFDKFHGKIVNVLINPLGILRAYSDDDIIWTALQDGKWDAAFKACKKDNIGFNFKGSPFGNDHFDYWPFYRQNYKYQDIFTGFIYYKSPTQFKLITGYNGLVDSSFLQTFKKRVMLWRHVVGNRLGFDTIDSLILKKYGKMNITRKENIDSIALQINKWLN
ncbi:MAG: hypothetical protein P8X47_07430 [Ignavibacteriaceae bacterium]